MVGTVEDFLARQRAKREPVGEPGFEDIPVGDYEIGCLGSTGTMATSESSGGQAGEGNDLKKRLSDALGFWPCTEERPSADKLAEIAMNVIAEEQLRRFPTYHSLRKWWRDHGI